MDREQMIVRAALAVASMEPQTYDLAAQMRAAFDEVLPQVDTVTELERLPAGVTLIGQAGERGPVFLRTLGGGECAIGGLDYMAADALHFYGPLTVWSQ